MQHSPSGGPALTVSGLIPDLHHYKGSFGGRAFPLWLDRACTMPNIRSGLIAELTRRYGFDVSPEDVAAYVVAVVSHSSFTTRFEADLIRPGLRVPFTSDGELFKRAAEVGRQVIWLQSFGERFVDHSAGRPMASPRMARDVSPKIPKGGAIGIHEGEMPDELRYDQAERRLYVGSGYIDGVSPEVWNYAVSEKRIIHHWFSYRKRDRAKPLIGERRTPSPLGDIQPAHWVAEYTTELMELLNVLGRIVELEPLQATMLQEICDGGTLSSAELRAAGVFELNGQLRKPTDVSRPTKSAPLQASLPGIESKPSRPTKKKRRDTR